MRGQTIAVGQNGLYNVDTFDYNGQGPLYLWWRPFAWSGTEFRMFVSESPFCDTDYVADGIVPTTTVHEAAEWFAALVSAATGCEVLIQGEKYDY